MKAYLHILLVAAFACGAAANAQEFVAPEQTIVGAEQPIPLGELVDLRVSKIEQPPANLSGTSYEWDVIDLPSGESRKIRQYNEGVLFGAGITSRRCLAICAATYTYIEKDVDGKVKRVATVTRLLKASVQLGDDRPPPPPNPPAPDPDTKFGLRKVVHESTLKHVVDATARKRGAAALAESYRKMKVAILPGLKLEEILKNTTLSNNEALRGAGVSRDEWIPVFEDLRDALYGQYDQKKVNTLDDFREAYQEIIEGFERGAQ